ncbi:hypothetical protein MVEG_04592 [Podila verticillata NRRL 6337]|nr:hypothetical protein MVEG_04592 [Podila verticillata NRRL 6337]
MTTQVAYHDITPRSSSTHSFLGEVCPMTHDAARMHQQYDHSLQHHYSRYAHSHDPNDSALKPPDDSGSETSQDETESRPRRKQHLNRKSSGPRGIVVTAEFRKHSEDTIREILARLEQRQHEMNSQRMYTLSYNSIADEQWPRVIHPNRGGYEVQKVHHSTRQHRGVVNTQYE